MPNLYKSTLRIEPNYRQKSNLIFWKTGSYLPVTLKVAGKCRSKTTALKTIFFILPNVYPLLALTKYAASKPATAARKTIANKIASGAVEAEGV